MNEKKQEIWKEILDLYKNMPCLWDATNKNYLNKDVRNHSLEILLEKYEILDVDATMAILKKKIENMRTSYKRELKKVKTSMRAGSDEIYAPNLWYFDLLTFLDEKDDLGRRGIDTSDSSNEASNDRKHIVSHEIGQSSTMHTPQQPAIKKPRTASNHSQTQERAYETPHKATPAKDEEWEIIAKSIGLQMKDLEKTQQTIAQKLISDALFYAKLGRLSEGSSISLGPIYDPAPMPTSTFVKQQEGSYGYSN